MEFSGKELVQEPDASSFPSGALELPLKQEDIQYGTQLLMLS